MVENQQNVLDRKVCLECHRQFTGIVAACPHDGTLLVNILQDPLIGTTLAGNYEILSILGQGGMGVVYKARHALMDRVVAIKMLQAQLITDSMSVKRFQQESKAASRINHPNVITVYDFGISPTGQPYIVMDCLTGVPLSDIIKTDGQVSVERTIKVMVQACDALDHAHRQGVIHRDLKPSNIVLINFDNEKDFVKVVDFGVAKLMNGTESQRLTQVGEVCGSPVYMSPEQCKGLELDARSDIYSMGIVLFESLTGHLPILGKTMVDTMSRHISAPPAKFNEVRPDLYIPERLESVVLRALAKDPADRQQTMAELMQEIDMAIPRPGRSQVLRTQPPPSEKRPDKKQSFSKRTPVRIAATVAVVGICGLAFAGWTKHLISLIKSEHAPVPKIAAPAVTAPAVTPPSTTPPLKATAPVTATVAPPKPSLTEPPSDQTKYEGKTASATASLTKMAPPVASSPTEDSTVVRKSKHRSTSTIAATTEAAEPVSKSPEPGRRHAYATVVASDEEAPVHPKPVHSNRASSNSPPGRRQAYSTSISSPTGSGGEDKWKSLWSLHSKY